MSKTLLVEIQQVQLDATKKLLKSYEKMWFYGNDGLYYYLIEANNTDSSPYLKYQSGPSCVFFECDGSKITNKIRLNNDNILSFQLIDRDDMLDTLNIILSKAFLTGVQAQNYKRRRYGGMQQTSGTHSIMDL